MKQFIVNTRLGRALLLTRNRLEIIIDSIRLDQSTGTKINDELGRVLVTNLCLPNKIFVDAGAHLGSVTSAAIHNTPSIKTILIEPIPDKVKNLQRNFKKSEIINCALGDLECETIFYVNKKITAESSLIAPMKEQSKFLEIKVTVRKLDNIINNPRDIDLIKIDVEGSELSVLRGASSIINYNRPTILFESFKKKDDTIELIWKHLSDIKYSIIPPNKLAHNYPGMSLCSFSESHFHPRLSTNYFAVANERREEIRDRARKILNILV